MGTIRSNADVVGANPAFRAADMLAGVSELVEDVVESSEVSDSPDRAVLACGRLGTADDDGAAIDGPATDPAVLVGRTYTSLIFQTCDCSPN
jgi:hypothetical protein